MQHTEQNKDELAWLDQPANVRRIVYTLYAGCALFALLDLLVPRESHFFFEAWPGFFAWYGLLACVGLVLAAKVLRKLLIRREHYYD
ncbi:MAG: hypothetical protein EXR08_00650 [Alphaproteobacteria bacterium]|nr:hypothetical protein [Alphaproteobacteria bacterium]